MSTALVIRIIGGVCGGAIGTYVIDHNNYIHLHQNLQKNLKVKLKTQNHLKIYIDKCS